MLEEKMNEALLFAEGNVINPFEKVNLDLPNISEIIEKELSKEVVPEFKELVMGPHHATLFPLISEKFGNPVDKESNRTHVVKELQEKFQNLNEEKKKIDDLVNSLPCK